MPTFTKTNKKKFYKLLTPNTLLTLDKIINFVKNSGVDFGQKNPRTQITYFARLGLFNNLTNKTTKNTNFAKISQTLTHLPFCTVERIVQIESLHLSGFSYRKITKIYNNLTNTHVLTQSTINHSATTYNLHQPRRIRNVLFVPKNGMRKKIEEYEKKFQSLLHLEFNSLATALEVQTKDNHTLTITKQLIPTTELIDIAKKSGIDLGSGDPTERIRYFIKLGILPHMVRKSTDKVESQSNKQVLQDSSLSTLTSHSTTGHLPSWSLERLVYVNKLYLRGLSYPQIAAKIKRVEKRNGQNAPSLQNTSVGLLNDELNRRLKIHEEKIEKIVKKKLDKHLEDYKQKLTALLSQKIVQF